MKRRSSNLHQPLGRKGARRRVRTRTALFLCLAALAGMLLTALLGMFAPPGVRVWLSGLASVVFFALPAYLGLCESDGDWQRLLPLRRLSGAQALWLAASGALLVCPATLLSDVIAAVIARFAAAFGKRARETVPADTESADSPPRAYPPHGGSAAPSDPPRRRPKTA